MPELWQRVSARANAAPEDRDRPFVQLSGDQMPAEELEEILGYAGIWHSNQPIGLPYPLMPITLGEGTADEVLLFPLEGLEAHLRSVAPDVAATLARYGSLDDYIDALPEEEDLTAREYLVGGVLECIRYCKDQEEALVITW